MDTAENMPALRCVRINGDQKKYWEKVSELFANAASTKTFNYNLLCEFNSYKNRNLLSYGIKYDL